MQQRKSTFSVLFFIKRKKLLKNGDAPVHMRVTIDGRFLEIDNSCIVYTYSVFVD
jgi:hypothetical protein